MPKPGLTAVLYVLDRSGSMARVWDDTVGAYKKFIQDQKALPGEAEFGLTHFDHEVVVRALKPIQEAEEDLVEIFPRGSTALFDAVGQTIHTAGIIFAGRNEDRRPERVLLVIQTDGEDNDSRSYSPERVKQLIQHQQEKYNWQVVFMGADQNAWKNASFFNANASLGYRNDKSGVHNSALYVTKQVSAYRITGNLSVVGHEEAK